MQLKDLKGPKKRKKVAVDLNTKFVNIDLIKESNRESREGRGTNRGKGGNITTPKSVCLKGHRQYIKIYVYRSDQS